jgi:hypothetical protein
MLPAQCDVSCQRALGAAGHDLGGLSTPFSAAGAAVPGNTCACVCVCVCVRVCMCMCARVSAYVHVQESVLLRSKHKALERDNSLLPLKFTK